MYCLRIWSEWEIFSIRGHNIISENLGVASEKNETKLTDMLSNIFKKQNYENTKISYL